MEELSRRRMVIAGAVGTTAWVAPAVLGVERVAAATGSVLPTNKAPGGTATQSSTGFGGVASRGNDGNTDGNYFANPRSVFHTGRERGAWWQVDLGVAVAIDEVRLWNRTDCCINRAQDLEVWVDGVLIAIDAGVTGNPSVVPINVTGRIVRIVNGFPGRSYFHLAEVEVIGV